MYWGVYLLDNIIIQICFKNYKKNSQEFLRVFFEQNRNTYNLIQPMKGSDCIIIITLICYKNK